MPNTDVLKFPTEFYDAYVFDMDGTIYLGDHLLPGAARMINELRRREIPVRYLSNNPTKDPDMYAAKLSKLGLPTPVQDIYNTIVTTVAWLKKNYPDAVLFPIAEEPLCRALRNAGFKLSEDPQEIDIVVASYDRTFEYRKLQIAFDAMWFYKRAFLIQTNPDGFCPFPGGRGEPDCASIVAAIEACTAMKCQRNLGKPDPIMLHTVMDSLPNAKVQHSVMVGDRLQTDIQMALDTDMISALVFTGEAKPEDLLNRPRDKQPAIVMDRVDRLIPQWAWDELGWTESDD